jgi:dGTPase
VANLKKSSIPKRDDRYFRESSEDHRTRFQRDRDRVLYTSSFHRLAGITQVASADEGHVFHNRLTHTLEVAQVARRIAEKLIMEHKSDVEALGGVDPDVAEACALVHDLGHPPFGHVAEKELHRLVSARTTRGRDSDGFEGNAQSFRIVTKLALRSFHYEGLNLTRATLNGTLKYPWLRSRAPSGKQGVTSKSNRKKQRKCGAYRSEIEHFRWARAMEPPRSEIRSLEAQIMDWADDVTYAVHDVTDFFKAGVVPLDRLAVDDQAERSLFYNGIFKHNDWMEEHEFSEGELVTAFEKLRLLFPIRERYAGTKEHRSALRIFAAGLIGECVKSVQVNVPKKIIRIPRETIREIAILKQLTWHYVILKPSLTTKQVGQCKIIRELFNIFHESAVILDKLEIFPTAYSQLIAATKNDNERTRLVADMISGMTEQQAISIHRKLTGVNLGSLLDTMT